MFVFLYSFFFFFFNDTATTEIYTLSLHDALPIYKMHEPFGHGRVVDAVHARDPRADVDKEIAAGLDQVEPCEDRKSTRLNSSHTVISYAVFCLKKKKKKRMFQNKYHM